MTNYEPTGVATMGGRGQEAPIPEDHVMHVMTITRTSETVCKDWFITAEQAIEQRAKRLKEAKTPYTRDGMTLRYTDRDGDLITLTYEDAS